MYNLSSAGRRGRGGGVGGKGEKGLKRKRNISSDNYASLKDRVREWYGLNCVSPKFTY